MKLKGLLAVAAAALVAMVVVAVSGGPAAEAKGPVDVSWDAQVGNGALPGVGNPVRSEIVLNIGGTATAGTVAFFDGTRTINPNVVPVPGPGHPDAGALPAAATGAQAGFNQFTIQTNVIGGLAGSGNIPGAGPFANLVPECGSNTNTSATYDWNGDTAVNSGDFMLRPTAQENLFIATMNGMGTTPSALFGPTGWVSTEYLAAGGPLVQTFDDDNQNGVPDSLEGNPNNEPAVNRTSPNSPEADPLANASIPARTAYKTGAVESQHDYDHDGLPNAIEAMPDVLPVIAQSLGLASPTTWKGRLYGAAEALGTLAVPTDVHFLVFDVSGTGSVTFTVLGNPLTPANPAAQATATCTPFSTNVIIDASTSAPTYWATHPLSGFPAGGTGQAVQNQSAAAPTAYTILITDGDDFDQDGRVASVEKCAFDTSNTDADNDWLSGACDPNDSSANIGGSADIDGDGFKNNVDNCPRAYNPTQADLDADGVGEERTLTCDPFLIPDSITGSPAGKGDGSGSNTSALIDNDLSCADPNILALGTPVTACTDVDDASDNGVADAADAGTDEDGDGCADSADPNPLDPFDCGNGLGGGDLDKDGCTNAEEQGTDPNFGGLKNPLLWWDNFDVDGSGGVDILDTLQVLAHFGHGPGDDAADQVMDRALPNPAAPWALIEDDNGVDLIDALNSLGQFGFGCSGAPGATPPAPGQYIPS